MFPWSIKGGNQPTSGCKMCGVQQNMHWLMQRIRMPHQMFLAMFLPHGAHVEGGASKWLPDPCHIGYTGAHMG